MRQAIRQPALQHPGQPRAESRASLTCCRLGTYVGATAWLLLLHGPAPANTAAGELTVCGEPTQTARFLGARPGVLRFEDAEGSPQEVASDQLVRWSFPRDPRARTELHLVDGTRVCLADPWRATPAIVADARTVSVETQLLGRLEFAREYVRGVLWNLPTDPRRRQEVAAAACEHGAEAPPKVDRLLLAGGDEITGRLLALKPDDSLRAVARFESTLGRLDIPAARLTAVTLRGSAAAPAENDDGLRLLIGLRDGSRLVATELVDHQSGFQVRLAAGPHIEGRDRRDIVSLQAIGGCAVYLSDRQPAVYRHVPYLEIPWPFQADRNVRGGPLRVGGRPFEKGLGLHSASRLTYDLGGDAVRFKAQVAVDDAARDRGSVVFRVYLSRGGQWHEAFASPPVRGGQGPQEVAVDLGDAEQISLVVDFGQHGDERDDADWLDARLE